MMTGTQQGAIDFSWLLANLEVGRVKVGQDEKFLHDEETFVLGPKAIMAAEAYVLGLFQLYPTVYLHKTTRGIEKLFSCLFTELISALRDGRFAATRLSQKHPIAQFAKDPNNIDAYLALDDSVVWGSLHLLEQSSIVPISKIAERLLRRQFYKCVNVTQAIHDRLQTKYPRDRDLKQKNERARAAEARIRELIAERRLLARRSNEPRLLDDLAERNPYKEVSNQGAALNQIWVTADGTLRDLGKLSTVVRNLVPFRAYRLYYKDESCKDIILRLLDEVLP